MRADGPCRALAVSRSMSISSGTPSSWSHPFNRVHSFLIRFSLISHFIRFSFASHSLLIRFSFASRSFPIRFSFASRSFPIRFSLVSHSLLICFSFHSLVSLTRFSYSLDVRRLHRCKKTRDGVYTVRHWCGERLETVCVEVRVAAYMTVVV